MSAGANHSAFISKANELYMCGQASKGQLGLKEVEIFVATPTKVRNDVLKVDCGKNHTLIISRSDGSVHSTGLNDQHQLGHS